MRQITFNPSDNFILQLNFEPVDMHLKCEQVLQIESDCIRDEMSRTENFNDWWQLCSYRIIIDRVIEQRKLGSVLN